MQTNSDEVLIAKIAQGDRLAMEALFARYRVRVFRFVLRMVRNDATAEDLNGDVFLDVWRQAGTFEGTICGLDVDFQYRPLQGTDGAAAAAGGGTGC